MARHPRKEGRSKKRGKKSASGRSGAPKRPQKRARKSVAKAAKAKRRPSNPAASLARELNEAQARQAATAEILKIIASSPDDVKPVFKAIVRTIVRVMRCDRAFIMRCEGKSYYPVANALADGTFGFVDLTRAEPIDPAANFPSRAIVTKKTVYYPDRSLIELPAYERMISEKYGVNASLLLPLLRQKECIGVLALASKGANAFSASDIALAESFRDQALIAIENARLFNETREALAQQTATSEVLEVISSSMGDVQPVFEQMLEKATRVCGAEFGVMGLYEGEVYRRVALYNVPPAFAAIAPKEFRPNPDGPIGTPRRTGQVFRLDDLSKSEAYLSRHNAAVVAMVEVAGVRTIAIVPMMKDGDAVGAIAIYRQEVRPFTDRQIELLKNFANQAVIAIENARLFNETREALERQTATADILKVIASSPDDVQPVFDAIAEHANRLIGGHATSVVRIVGDVLELVAHTYLSEEADVALRAAFPIPIAGLPQYELMLRGEVTEITDTEAEVYVHYSRLRQIARAAGFRSRLMVPLKTETGTIGAIAVTRVEPGQFAEHHIQLLKTFADQAVIAIQNVRLFNETKEALEYQKASAGILSVISSSVAETQPVFDEILRSIEHLFGAEQRVIFLIGDDDLIRVAAVHGPDNERTRALFPQPLKGSVSELAFSEHRVISYDDVYNNPDVPPVLRDVSRRFGQNYSMALAPMMREGHGIGSILVSRLGESRRPFNEAECNLLRSFADQAVVAIENARLFNETKEALERQTATADILKVIAGSPSELRPVFDAIAARSLQLVDADSATVSMFVGDRAELGAFTPVSPEADAALIALYPRRLADYPLFELVRGGEVAQVPDIETESRVPPAAKVTARKRGFRSILLVPMNGENGPVGIITVTRREPGAFAQKHVELLQTFADQAVIAIQNTRLFNETREALARQTATADVLKVIASSPSNLQPVFDAIAERSKELVGGHSTTVFRFAGDMVELVAATSVNAEADAVLRAGFPRPIPAMQGLERTFRGEMVETVDAAADTESEDSRNIARARGFRSRLVVPLNSDNGVIGAISTTRSEAGAFANKDVELLRTFADQAVIAIQNVKLFEEVQAKTRDLEESLQQQTATADVLKVISRSAFDLDTVMSTLVRSAVELCGTTSGVLWLRDGDRLICRGSAVDDPAALDFMIRNPVPINAESHMGRAVLTGTVSNIPDVVSADSNVRKFREVFGFRSFLGVPLMREGRAIGVFTLTRDEIGAFSQRQVDLVQGFADQAVIAIENARLFNEVQAKTRDLEESLQQQTATADVLKVISRSAFDLDAVMDTLARSALDLCGSKTASLFLREEDTLVNRGIAAHEPVDEELMRANVVPLNDESHMGRALLTGTIANIGDFENNPHTKLRKFQQMMGFKSFLAVPLMREGRGVGVFALTRDELGEFNQRQVDLVQGFADQAVIAIENTRLFNQTTEALERQTATADILKVIASSPDDVQPVFQAIADQSKRLLNGLAVAVYSFVDDMVHLMSFTPVSSAADAHLKAGFPLPLAVSYGSLRAAKGEIFRVTDTEEESVPERFRDIARNRGWRSAVFVPLLSDGRAIGAISVTRAEPGSFADHHVEILKTFADQAVIAIQNVELFQEVQQRTRELSQSLDDLRAAQDRLVQTEKLASLGQLTAGIAHEIKNPLNFVNNFSALSVELTDELNDVLKQAELAEKIKQEVGELTQLLKSNLEKIVQHGKRADSIVKNMLLHSREGSGEQRAADINALVEESLNLAYHGARAEKSGFNITLERAFDAGAGSAELYPQEMTRALLNLISNGFYAASKRKAENGETAFEPTLLATTKDRGTSVEIRIRDNGTGIPPEVKEKMFNPFFTTKPAGEGTGLGLSMTHDIIVKQHGGTIDVATEPGNFTEFIVVLPRANGAQGRGRDRA